MCFFILLIGVLSVAANPVLRDPFSFVPSVFVQKSTEKNSSDHVLGSCSDLWTNSTAEFLENSRSRFLGSREELPQLCQPRDVTPICLTTRGLINYICSPVSSVQYFVESEVNNTAHGICLTFQNETFVSNLEEIALQSINSTNNPNNSATSDARKFNFTDCEQVCSSSIRLCQIILQSLKTITSKAKTGVVDKQLKQLPESKLEVTVSPSTAKAPSSTPTSATNTSNQHLLLTTDNKIPKAPVNPEGTEDKPVIQTTAKDTENKDWSPSNMSPDGADEDLLDEMEKPDPSDDDLDIADKDSEVVGNKLNNDAFVGTPTKPSQSYDSESEIDEDPVNTHFIFYFLAFVAISVCGYLLYQRRNRIIALVLEGRGGPGRRRGRSSRSRGSSGSYHKLVNNLEEAITSHSVKNSNVVY